MYSLTNFLSLNSAFLHNIRSKQYKAASADGNRCNWKCLTTSLCLVFLSWGRLILLRSYHIWVPSDYVPSLDNETFVTINTQPSNVQGEHWIMISNFRHELYFADSLGREKYSFLKQYYKQMIPAPLQSHPSVCGFYTIYAAFYLFKFRQEKITGVHDVNVLSSLSIFM